MIYTGENSPGKKWKPKHNYKLKFLLRKYNKSAPLKIIITKIKPSEQHYPQGKNKMYTLFYHRSKNALGSHWWRYRQNKKWYILLNYKSNANPERKEKKIVARTTISQEFRIGKTYIWTCNNNYAQDLASRNQNLNNNNNRTVTILRRKNLWSCTRNSRPSWAPAVPCHRLANGSVGQAEAAPVSPAWLILPS